MTPRLVTAGELAAAIDELARPRLIVFDCDGVLAPIVAHADDAVLSPGVGDALAQLSHADDTTVAVLSGRSLAGLAQFELAESVEVLGSYGSERRGRSGASLSAEQTALLGDVAVLAADAVETAGDGAWVEHKPASVVVHVREADADLGATALRRARDEAHRMHGVFVHEGKAVVELAVHRTDKGSAISALVTELGPASVVYFGDDEPDEMAFNAIGRAQLTSIGVRVGAVEASAATHQLADSSEIAPLLAAINETR